MMIGAVAVLGVITGSLVDNVRQLERDVARSGDGVVVALDEVLAHLRVFAVRREWL